MGHTVIDDETLINWRTWKDPEGSAIHTKESTITENKISKRAIRELRASVDPHFGSPPVFSSKNIRERRASKHVSLMGSACDTAGTTEQELLYASSRSLAVLVKGASVGDTFAIESDEQSSIDPNNIVGGIKFGKSAVIIHNPHQAIAIPFKWCYKENMYMIPAGMKFRVLRITQESWKTRPMVSCKSEHGDISVYHLAPAGETNP